MVTLEIVFGANKLDVAFRNGQRTTEVMRNDAGELFEAFDLSFELFTAAFGTSTLNIEQAEADADDATACHRGAELLDDPPE
jgi:hypothetical protein